MMQPKHYPMRLSINSLENGSIHYPMSLSINKK